MIGKSERLSAAETALFRLENRGAVGCMVAKMNQETSGYDIKTFCFRTTDCVVDLLSEGKSKQYGPLGG